MCLPGGCGPGPYSHRVVRRFGEGDDAGVAENIGGTGMSDGPILPVVDLRDVAGRHDVVRVPDVDLRAAGVPGQRRVWRPAGPEIGRAHV